MINSTWLPWTDYPGVTQERLLFVGDIIRIARQDAVDDHRPIKGETNWSLGVRCYERTCYALAVASQQYSWLVITCGAGGGPVHFVMTIGGHPVRFCKGEPDDVPPRYQQLSLPEMAQQALLGFDTDVPQGRGLRIMITNDVDGMPSDIHLVEVDDMTKGVTNVYLIPAIASTTTFATFAPPPVPPVTIPPVSAEPLDTEVEEEASADKTGSDDE
jgi:hypothetical protein